MAITPGFNIQTLKDLLDSVPKILAEEVIRAFSYLGEQCVKMVRDRSADASWYDHTGNLRSSIGYAVIEDGKKIIESAFKQVGAGALGPVEGRKMIDELAVQYARTYALVVVAGMEYAEFVEAMKGKDVLSSTKIWAKSKISGYIEKAMGRAQKRIAGYQNSLGL